MDKEVQVKVLLASELLGEKQGKEVAQCKTFRPSVGERCIIPKNIDGQNTDAHVKMSRTLSVEAERVIKSDGSRREVLLKPFFFRARTLDR